MVTGFEASFWGILRGLICCYFRAFWEGVATLLQALTEMLPAEMGTITSRCRKDGTTAYLAQIRIMRDRERVYQEA